MATKNEEHFRPDEWVDFVNGNLSADQRKTIEQHLNEECIPCSNLASLWARVRQLAKSESSYEVPESSLRHVRSAFRILAPTTVYDKLVEVPRLLFDSLWQHVAVGVRAGAGDQRRLVYEASGVAIEISCEEMLDSNRLTVVGQVCARTSQRARLSDVPVVITSNGSVVARTKTNEFGEFQLNFARANDLRISLGIAEGQTLCIPFDDYKISSEDQP